VTERVREPASERASEREPLARADKVNCTSRKRSRARRASPPPRCSSGWQLSAILRYAARISSSVSPTPTPNTSAAAQRESIFVGGATVTNFVF
jgi:hypothetical protein